ncbi:hypothetical protein JZ751_029051 [Albula glossodonta]|uniref:Uncharacterized protein n=1 Tax=Albula glossodonta TaxID=121402 RepID=A0A8T2P813_9TELE|nr:hypothetical protein JZ751_029051 [Albula glossodonta]
MNFLYNLQEDLQALSVEGVYFCASVWLNERGTPGETAVNAECLHQPEQHSLHPLLPPRSAQRGSGYRDSRLPQIAFVEPAKAEDTARALNICFASAQITS